MALQTVPVAAFIPTLSLAAPGALYEQIMAGVHAAVANGQLQPGAALPSVRQLAAETRVSVITVKRAYEELEREGILYSRPGLGSFISDAAVECTRKTHRARAEALLTDARLEAERAGLKPSEIRALFLKHL
jgi:GntR family transcriptional regulator